MATAMLTGIRKKPKTPATAPTPAAPPTPKQKPQDWFQSVLPRIVLPVFVVWLGSVLLWLSFFPVSWGFLGWVALAPFLTLVRSQLSARMLYALAYLGGFSFFLPALQWMRVADDRMVYAWIFLSIYCALYFPAALFLMRRLDRSGLVPLWLGAPAVWVGLEFIRSIALTGFAWYYLGHTQHDFLQIIQIADIAGVYGVSFLVAGVNAWLVDALYRWADFRRWLQQTPPPQTPRWELGNWQSLAGGLTVLAGLFIAALAYGDMRLGQDKFLPGPRVVMLQTNIPQRIRDGADDSDLARRAIMQGTSDLFRFCYDHEKNDYRLRPELVIWPETSYPNHWAEDNINIDTVQIPDEYKQYAEIIKGYVKDIASHCPTHHLIGLNSEILGDDAQVRPYNSALLIDAKGQKLTRYDKIHRVPFGEYVPMKDWIGWLSPYKEGLMIYAGKEYTRFHLKGKLAGTKEPVTWKFGVLICYEDTDPFMARRYGREHEDGPPVDFLVNISNDGWFDGTCEHEEHLAISRFRAIETRRAVVRSVNMGISAVIDSNGRVQRPKEFRVPGFKDQKGRVHTTLPHRNDNPKFWMIQESNHQIPDLPVGEWGEYKKVDGVLHATVPIDRRDSFYTLAGDWLPAGCWGLVGIVLTVLVVRRVRQRTVLAA